MGKIKQGGLTENDERGRGAARQGLCTGSVYMETATGKTPAKDAAVRGSPCSSFSHNGW